VGYVPKPGGLFGKWREERRRITIWDPPTLQQDRGGGQSEECRGVRGVFPDGGPWGATSMEGKTADRRPRKFPGNVWGN